jgi:hypothetical protein
MKLKGARVKYRYKVAVRDETNFRGIWLCIEKEDNKHATGRNNGKCKGHEV